MVVGIDVSKNWLDASWSIAGAIRTQQFAYSDKGIEQLLEQTPSTAVFVMEATGTYHARLALRLFEAGRQVSVVNPLVIKRYGQMKLLRVKSDRADAVLIMEYGQHEKPPLWEPVSEEVQELQQAHGWLNDLIGERTRLLNRKQAHSHRAIPSAFVVKQMDLQLAQLQQRIRECEIHLEQLVKSLLPSCMNACAPSRQLEPKPLWN